MPGKHYTSETGLEHRDTFRRPAPRCYSRPGMSKAISESRTDKESNAILIGLSIVSAAAFVIVYGGWSF